MEVLLILIFNIQTKKNKKGKKKKIWTPHFPEEGYYNWISDCDFFANGNVMNEELKGQQWNDIFIFSREKEEDEKQEK